MDTGECRPAECAMMRNRMLLRSKPAAAWPESYPHLHTHNPQSWREGFSIWRDMSTVRALEWVTIYESTSMTLRRLLSIFLLAPLLASAAPAPRERVALSGEWNFFPDVGEATLAEVKMPPAKITVPGAWQAEGFGTPGGSIPSSVVGSEITPAAYLRHNLTARCLYARSVAVPEEWRGPRVFLCVRRVYRYADVTVNGKRVGEILPRRSNSLQPSAWSRMAGFVQGLAECVSINQSAPRIGIVSSLAIPNPQIP